MFSIINLLYRSSSVCPTGYAAMKCYCGMTSQAGIIDYHMTWKLFLQYITSWTSQSAAHNSSLCRVTGFREATLVF